MSISSGRSLRRHLCVAAATVALLAMAAGPALAAGGYASIQRGFTISGDRDRVSIVATITQGAAGSGIGLGVGFGREGTTNSVAVSFTQGMGKAGSRGLKVDGYSAEYKAVSGTNCIYEYRLACDRPGYDWVQGRAYKVSFVRGNNTAQGWLWKVSIRDQHTGTTTQLVQFRAPWSQLSNSSLNGVYAYANPDDCSNIPTFTAAVRKPAGAGSSVQWDGKPQPHSECAGATVAAPIDDGVVKFKIT